jgi:hypothetical protein
VFDELRIALFNWDSFSPVAELRFNCHDFVFSGFSFGILLRFV